MTECSVMYQAPYTTAYFTIEFYTRIHRLPPSPLQHCRRRCQLYGLYVHRNKFIFSLSTFPLLSGGRGKKKETRRIRTHGMEFMITAAQNDRWYGKYATVRKYEFKK